MSENRNKYRVSSLPSGGYEVKKISEPQYEGDLKKGWRHIFSELVESSKRYWFKNDYAFPVSKDEAEVENVGVVDEADYRSNPNPDKDPLSEKWQVRGVERGKGTVEKSNQVTLEKAKNVAELFEDRYDKVVIWKLEKEPGEKWHHEDTIVVKEMKEKPKWGPLEAEEVEKPEPKQKTITGEKPKPKKEKRERKEEEPGLFEEQETVEKYGKKQKKLGEGREGGQEKPEPKEAGVSDKVQELISKQRRLEEKIDEVTEGGFFGGLDHKGVVTLEKHEMDHLIREYPQAKDLIIKALKTHIKQRKEQGYSPSESVEELLQHVEQKKLEKFGKGQGELGEEKVEKLEEMIEDLEE